LRPFEGAVRRERSRHPELLRRVAPAPDTLVTLIPPDQRVSLISVFADARPYVRVLMVVLLVAALASLAIWVAAAVRRTGPEHAARASAQLAMIGTGGLMVGLLAGADNLLHICMGIANKRPEATIIMLAPGLAETLLCVTLGLLAATIAAIGRRHLSLRKLALPA
jgi:hypothetical protein